MTGSDALLLHMEDEDTHGHTLKVLVLDPALRGRPVTLAEMAAAIEPRLGLVARATQKLVAPRGFGGLPYWMFDPHFRLADHLDEVTAGPGGLDAECARLAREQLPRQRPLWAMTLVHGLPGGRQAVIVRVHHAVTDGLGALNAFLACTTETRGEPVPFAPRAVGFELAEAELRRAALRATGELIAAFPRLARDGVASARRARDFRRRHPQLARFRDARRRSFNSPGRTARTCATGSLPLAPLKAIAKASGTTVNSVFHAVVAGAMRRELVERGEPVGDPTAASFAIAVDKSDRRFGNFVTPAFVTLPSHLADPLARLDATARSCHESVELKRTAGLEMAGRWAAYAPRAITQIRRLAANRVRTVGTHIQTANVPGPARTRWLGDVEVVEWFSFAMTVAPANINLTVYSYDGRLNMGLVATPEAMPDPRRFLERLRAELDVLADHALPPAEYDDHAEPVLAGAAG